MADVRSMLRAERQSRRITHPNASYTSDGKLLCNLCETLVKSEAHWQSHLHSTQHTLRSQRAQEVKDARGVEKGGKKRKAEALDTSAEDERKRARPTEAEDAGIELDGEDGAVDEETHVEAQQDPASTTMQQAQTTAPETVPPASVDEDEFAAFEREIAQLESQAAPASALSAEATISAAPMTAEQLAAQAREEQSAQRGKRDAELEDEREDAARVLEEEFEQMEGYEDRARKLRERREALRKESSSGDPGGGAAALEAGDAVLGRNAVDADVSEDDEDYDDEWAFGGS